MPKIPREELHHMEDSDSEEYAPTTQEIDSEEEVRQVIHSELADIEDTLRHPTRDKYTGEEDEFFTDDPDSLQERLERLRSEDLKKIKDPHLKKELSREITEVGKKIYRHYIPFIDTLVNQFGSRNSPAEPHHRETYRMHRFDVDKELRQARTILAGTSLSADQKTDYEGELNRLEDKLNRYEHEPYLFSFENIENYLHKSIHRSPYYYSWSEEMQTRSFGSAEADEKTQLQFMEWHQKTEDLITIAELMQDKTIAQACKERAHYLLRLVTCLEFRATAPRTLLALEAELKDILQNIQDGRAYDEGRISEIDKQVTGFGVGPVGTERVTQLLNMVKRAQSGETITDEDEFSVDKSQIDWAWKLLGVPRTATANEIKSAYRKLARKYHPDTNKDLNPNEAKERMQKVNEAYSMIERLVQLN